MTLDPKFVRRDVDAYRTNTERTLICLEGHPKIKQKVVTDPRDLSYYEQIGLLEIDPSFTSIDECYAIVLAYSKDDEDSIKYLEYLSTLKLPNKPIILMCVDEYLNTPIIEDRVFGDSRVAYFEGVLKSNSDLEDVFIEAFQNLVFYLIGKDIGGPKKNLTVGPRKFIDSFIAPDTNVHLSYSSDTYKDFDWFDPLREYLSKMLNEDLESAQSYDKVKFRTLISDREILAVIHALGSPRGAADLKCRIAPFEVSHTEATLPFIREVLNKSEILSLIFDSISSDPLVESTGFYKPGGMINYTKAEKILKKLTEKDLNQQKPYRCLSLLEMTALRYGTLDRLKYSLDHFNDGLIALDVGHSFYFHVSNNRSIRTQNMVSQRGHLPTVVSGRPSPDLIYGLNELYTEWLDIDSLDRIYVKDHPDKDYYTALKIQLYAFVIGHFENAKFVSENYPRGFQRYLQGVLNPRANPFEISKNRSGDFEVHSRPRRVGRLGYSSGGGVNANVMHTSLLTCKYPLSEFRPFKMGKINMREAALRVARSL